jgi:hypothetical protein
MRRLLEHVEIAVFWLLISGCAAGQIFLLFRLGQE